MFGKKNCEYVQLLSKEVRVSNSDKLGLQELSSKGYNMTTLIAYGSKTGTAKQAAELISSQVPDAQLADLSKEQPNLAAYDAAIIGGGVRVGSVNKDVKRFIDSNKSALAEMPVAFYITNCFTDNAGEIIDTMLSPDLKIHARFAGTVGGTLDIDKLKGFDKAIAKMVSKAVKDGQKIAEELDEDAIKRLVESVL